MTSRSTPVHKISRSGCLCTTKQSIWKSNTGKSESFLKKQQQQQQQESKGVVYVGCLSLYYDSKQQL